MNESSTQRLLIVDHSAGIRLDLFLAGHFNSAGGSGERLSRSEIQRLIGEGQITLNGVATKASARIRTNDQIDIHLLPPRDATVRSEALPLEILYGATWVDERLKPGLRESFQIPGNLPS